MSTLMVSTDELTFDVLVPAAQAAKRAVEIAAETGGEVLILS